MGATPFTRPNAAGNVLTALERVEMLIAQQSLYLRTQIAQSVQTLDTVVSEVTNIELTAENSQNYILRPQSRQTELIRTVMMGWASVDHPIAAAATLTLHVSYVQLGTTRFALLPNRTGAQFQVISKLTLIVPSNATRQLMVQNIGTKAIAAGTYFTVGLFGSVIPATLGEVLS
ncbi:MAG: hypothetical protein ACREHG_04315 [Candidatus Saccharimonadales bacterium]